MILQILSDRKSRKRFIEHILHKFLFQTKKGLEKTNPFLNICIIFYLSSSAATPGRTFPSINSNEAPPPVET